VNEGIDAAFVTLLVLIMEDMEAMFSAINATLLSFFNYNYRSTWPFVANFELGVDNVCIDKSIYDYLPLFY
jgi:phenylalanyl-tRNA synthetase beta subunit